MRSALTNGMRSSSARLRRQKVDFPEPLCPASTIASGLRVCF